jgi:trehalose synthase
MPQEIPVPLRAFERWAEYATPERMAALERGVETARARLQGRALWTVSSTRAGGGVAEMLHSLLGYARGAGIDARWIVMDGTLDFFRFTKRLHNALHGVDVEPPGDADRRLYEETSDRNALELAGMIRPGDVVMLHDPQTAGLAPDLARLGARLIWRCHIGHDHMTDGVRRAWRFLLPSLESAHALVFTRRAYVPPDLEGAPVTIIPPSIDPFTPKNQGLTDACVRSILVHTGLLAGAASQSTPCFLRGDGSPGRVDRAADVIRLGAAPAPDVPMVVQVSRWDRLKDPLGVLRGFVSPALLAPCELVLAGPTVHAVADDPEGAEVFNEVLDAWRALPHHQRRRVHLVNLPMADADENAAIVNALQRHAAVVVQKSLHEGFGLTVTEAMWKGRPVVASAVGGIQDQITDGVDGLLLRDPRDLDAFADAVRRLLDDPTLAAGLAAAARESVRSRYLGLETLVKYAELLERLDA